jgi:hypothetical protein
MDEDLRAFRNKLLEARTELIAELRKITGPVYKLINAIDSETGVMLKELSDSESAPVTRKITVRPGEPLEQVPMPLLAPKLEPGKRACSLCHHPGHRATNCPNAHIVREQEVAKKIESPAKKARAPMSPERKAQLVAALKKARAARGKKGRK